MKNRKQRIVKQKLLVHDPEKSHRCSKCGKPGTLAQINRHSHYCNKEGVIIVEQPVRGALEEGSGSSADAAAAAAFSKSSYSSSFKKEKKKIILMVIGEPCSGKTSLIKHLLANIAGCGIDQIETVFNVIADASRGIMEYEFETSEYCVSLIDTLGTREALCEMISGACSAHCTILVVDSTTEFSDSNQHALIAHTLGVKEVICCLNKMDMVLFSQEVFKMVKNNVFAHLDRIGFNVTRVPVVPISASEGLNLTKKALETKWFEGPTLTEAITKVKEPASIYKSLRLPVKEKSHDDINSHLYGRVESGSIREGMNILIAPGSWKTKVLGLVRDAEPVSEVGSGYNVEIRVAGVKGVEGMVISDLKSDAVKEVCSFVGKIFILRHPGQGKGEAEAERVVTVGFEGNMLCHGVALEVEIVDIISIVDRVTGAKLVNRPRCIKEGEAALVQFNARKPSVMEKVSDYPPLGRFCVIKHGLPVLVGCILEVTVKDHKANDKAYNKKGKGKMAHY